VFLYFLRLLDADADLLARIIIAGSHGESRRARAVNPLVKELVDVPAGRLLDGLGQVRADHILQAVGFEVMFERAEERLIAHLFAEHVDHPARFVVDVADVFH
jgi:hypothetical protein